MSTTPTRQTLRELEAELSKAHETRAKLEEVIPRAEQLLAERQADLDDLIRQNNAVVDRLNAARQDLADAGALRSTGAAGKLQPQDPARAGQALAAGSWAMTELERLTPLLAERRSLVA
jgi:ABC-type transporter Mla subunit MlaD